MQKAGFFHDVTHLIDLARLVLLLSMILSQRKDQHCHTGEQHLSYLNFPKFSDIDMALNWYKQVLSQHFTSPSLAKSGIRMFKNHPVVSL